MKTIVIVLIASLVCSCNWFQVRTQNGDEVALKDSSLKDSSIATALMTIDTLSARDSFPADGTLNVDTALLPPSKTVNTGKVHPNELISFAETLKGTPYVYASSNPNVGFDCSGFITYVFNHFKISVPRSSIDFTNVGKTVEVKDAKRGDIILFTGTDSTEKFVGHMGLVVSNNANELQFIHSTSGKAKSVAVTPLNDYYKKRFVRVTRIFPQNDSVSRATP